MKESEKTKNQIELERLKESEKILKDNDDKKIKKLLEELDCDDISSEKYIIAINSQVSFELSIDNDTEEE